MAYDFEAAMRRAHLESTGMSSDVIEDTIAAEREKDAAIYQCTGCGRITDKPDLYLKILREAGKRSCCPERDMQPIKEISPPASELEAQLAERVKVKPLDDDQIMEIIKEVAPWKTEPKLNDLLTCEKSPPMFPQATYDVPSYRATKLVRAVEARILSALEACPPAPKVTTQQAAKILYEAFPTAMSLPREVYRHAGEGNFFTALKILSEEGA